jgi:epoxyqueuosine reductase
LFDAAHPKSIMPDAKSVVVTIYDHFKESFPQQMVNKIGRWYQSYGASATKNTIHRARHRKLIEFMEKQGAKVTKNTFVPSDRQAAARAGLATFGNNCFVFAEGIGSWMVIYTDVVDVDLEYGEPSLEVKCPEGCTLCLDSCPTGAIYEPLKMNPLRCIAFNSFVVPGSLLATGHDVLPMDIRENMGSWVYGCDICQEVCPRNQLQLKAKLPPSTYLEHIADDFRLDKLLSMSDEYFHSKILPLLDYIRDKRYLKRNAAVALGNLGEGEAIPALAQAMRDTDELIRGHSAWALGKIGGSKARRILEISLSRETSSYAREEIVAALER